MKRIAVFASGTGSNFEAIHDSILKGNLDAEIAVLVVDQPKAAVIEKAKNRNVETLVLSPKDYASKAEYETVILNKLQELQVEEIVLAGYMRLISDVLLTPYQNHIVNIHPSLLPDFKGKDAIGQAIAAGAKRMGVTIHYVDSGMDTGSIIAQESFEVQEGMSKEEIEHQIHAIEHVLYTNTLKKLWEETK